jgi:hypothetical protein
MGRRAGGALAFVPVAAACVLWAWASLFFSCSHHDDGPKTFARFDLAAIETDFFAFPYPSDLRLTPDGTPDIHAFPNPDHRATVEGFRTIASQRKGFPVMPIGYVRFTGPLAPHDPEVVLSVDDDTAGLVDVDPTSPELGRRFPVVLATPPADPFVPDGLLAIAPRPGFVLSPHRRYAFFVTNALSDANGTAVGPAATWSRAIDGTDAVSNSVAPFVAVAKKKPGLRERVVAATVFTTGDVATDLATLADRVVAAYDRPIGAVSVMTDGPPRSPRYCALSATMKLPQFQVGTPPFNDQGLFAFGADGLPTMQREETVPVTFALPSGTMPADGYPTVIYVHGSGGLSTQMFDRGPVTTPGGTEARGQGPSDVLAARGLASVSLAMPVNPERLPGASELAFLNLQNLPAFRDTFRQGVLDAHAFLHALDALRIPPDAVAACAPNAPLSLPAGETAFHFDTRRFGMLGQSMGAMYANMIGATHPKIDVVVPTGSGGYWTYFLLKTSLVPGQTVGRALVGTTETLTFLHPALHMAETGWEPAEPFVYMARVGREPLAGHPVRAVYQSAGAHDSYFPTELYDAVALAFGHQQAGTEVWPTMQEALALDGRQGLLAYPVTANARSTNGATRTSAIVQYEEDPILKDGHYIFSQREEVKYQYGCFLRSFFDGKVPTVYAPPPAGASALTTACP